MVLVSSASLPPQLGALAQQTAVTTDQIGIDRFQLEDNAVQPLAAQSWFAAYQIQIQRTESNAAQGADQVQLSLQRLAIASGLSPTAASKFELQLIAFLTDEGPQQGSGLIPLNQIPIVAAAVGPQAAEQLNRFQQVGFADAVGADHQQPGLGQRQLQPFMVPEPLELELVKPDGIRCDVWVRYP